MSGNPCSRALRNALLFAGMSIAGIRAAVAGMPEGPYIVWVNLEESSEASPSKAVHEYLQKQRGDEFCGDTALAWVVYTHTRPTGVTNELVFGAMVERKPAAKKALINLLKSFKDNDVQNGLDGVIAYSRHDGAHMIGMDIHGKVRQSPRIENAADSVEIMKDFCAVYPDSFRR